LHRSGTAGSVPRTSPAAEASLKTIRVLIADDDPGLRTALSELLGHEEGLDLVGVAEDADEAIRIAGQRRPHVALVDVKMPAGGGPRAARGIVRVSPRTRVIALSAFEDRATVLEMIRAGAVGYLAKGTMGVDLVQSISRVAEGGTSLSAGALGDVVRELSSQLRREEIELEGRVARVERIRRFIAGKGLSLVFQPILDLRTREVVGVEALARFDAILHRPPDEWFAEAHELELGLELELAAVRLALASIDRLLEPDGDRYLSLNASHRTASSDPFLDLVGEHGGRVVVEITEHEPVDDYDRLAKALDRLRERGARIAIDDAGAGFSSLRHTLQLAPDIVKVDVSITRAIDSDRAKRALASALISFAEELEMTIVAEGIETREELDVLLELGVPMGQGFHLAKPSPLD
jgi:EAL domain-containing protein (putative c-di-GMP-specific phosphodiesterase class I)/CheY-like chemotaxis protein